MNIIQDKQALDLVCKELGVLDIKFIPSPNANSISELAQHATLMLRNYQKYLAGDKSSNLQEIFTS